MKSCWHKWLRKGNSTESGDGPDCPFNCKPPRVPDDVFMSLKPLPPPLKASEKDESFMRYEDAWRAAPFDSGPVNEAWCPSVATKNAVLNKLASRQKEQERSGQKVTGKNGDCRPNKWRNVKESPTVLAPNVWKTIPCGDCKKHRIVFLDRQAATRAGFSEDDCLRLLTMVRESEMYLCGEPLPSLTDIYDGDEQWQSTIRGGEAAMAVRIKVDCITPVEDWIFTKNVGLGDAQSLCGWCGEPGAPVPDREGGEDCPEGFTLVFPRCSSCEELGLPFRTAIIDATGTGARKRKAQLAKLLQPTSKHKSASTRLSKLGRGRGRPRAAKRQRGAEGETEALRGGEEKEEEEESGGGREEVERDGSEEEEEEEIDDDDDDNDDRDDDDDDDQEEESGSEEESSDDREEGGPPRASLLSKVPTGMVRTPEADDASHCMCGGPFNGDHDPMVMCDTCGIWYHYRCIGITQEPPKTDDQGRPLLWYCELEEDCYAPMYGDLFKWGKYTMAVQQKPDTVEGEG